MKSMDHVIPKRIIQTGKNSQLDLPGRAIAANIRLMNPDFEYMFFDNAQVEEFIDHEFPQYRAIFDSFRFPIQRYDFFRYLSVYRFGGFYFDLDVLLADGLSSLLESGCVFPFEGLTLSRFLRTQYGMNWELGNYAFGAAAGHPFLKAVIENCVKAQKEPGWVKPMLSGYPPLLREEYVVLNTTGPGLLTRTFAEDAELSKSVRVLFQEDLYDERTWNRFGNIGVHLMNGTWRLKAGFLRRKLAQYWEVRSARQVLKEASKKRTGQTLKREGEANKKVETA